MKGSASGAIRSNSLKGSYHGFVFNAFTAVALVIAALVCLPGSANAAIFGSRSVSKQVVVQRNVAPRQQVVVQRQVIQQHVIAQPVRVQRFVVQQQAVYAQPVIAQPVVVQQLNSGGCYQGGAAQLQLNAGGGCSVLYGR